MTLDDLLILLREEFALDVPAAQQALTAAVSEPACAAQHLEDMPGLIERSIQASALIGLHGWGGYLQQVAEFTRLQIQAPEPTALLWLRGWLTPAQAYLLEPAQEGSTQAILDYLRACPVSPDESVIELLQGMLMLPPTLSMEEAQAQQPNVAAATADDVSLRTDEVDTGLLQALLVDAPEQLGLLLGHLEKLATNQASVPELVEAQRIAHTFKGSGNIIGLPGIGRLAHRLEDVMEWALERVNKKQAVNPAAVRDMQQAVVVLEQMVGFLQGEEEQPVQALPVLQRMIDWVRWIHADEADGAQPESVHGTQDATNLGAVHAYSTGEIAENATQNEAQNTVSAGAAPIADAQTLRVGVDRLNRALRRAGHAIVTAQRVAQLLSNSQERLQAIELHHASLNQRLRELEQTVDKQVVELREQREAGGNFDPLEMDRYDALHGLSRFVTEAVQDQLEMARQARSQTDQALRILRDEDPALREQHRELLQSRLVPVKTMVPRLKRNVAQTASSTGKRVQLVIHGESTTLDADVLTRLTEPLLHLLRNAVDHGLELAEDRALMGKPELGTITLSFRRSGQEVEVICADDGRGLDLPTIYDKAVEYGLIAAGTDLSEDELRRLILRPGFSTKTVVTEVSGRGVGMDVVNDRIAGLKGRLAIESAAFEGTRFILHVPVSSGAAQALVVKCADELVALPTDQVVAALAAGDGEIVAQDNGAVLLYQGVQYPAYSLAAWLGFEEPKPLVSGVQKTAVLAKGMLATIALLVDGVVDARELILQDVGRLMRRIAGVVGGALRSDGKPMFVLDVSALERAARSSVRMSASLSLRKRLAVQRTRVLVVDDALSVRRSMEQLLEDAGYEVASANDGFQALDSMREKMPAIVLTDLEMPNLNGLDLTRRIRELPQYMGLPVVMITSRATEKHRDLAMTIGVDVYLTKPYADAALLEHVRRLTIQDMQSLML